MSYRQYLIICFSVLLVKCQEKKEVAYFDNGKVKFEVPTKNGNRNGIFKEYYPSGSLKAWVTFVDNFEEGKYVVYYENGSVSEISEFKNGKHVDKTKLFFESGELAEVTFYDYRGRPIDFINYSKSGERSSLKSLMIYSFNEFDTIEIDEYDTLFVKLGNAEEQHFNKGCLVITSDLTSKNFPVDTLAIINSQNSSGFLYKFSPKSAGENLIRGVLFFDSNNVDLATHYGFEYTYFAK